MAKYTCLIIEDEPLAMERTTLFIGKVPDLVLVGAFDNALDGLSFLKKHPVDILFLDIQMDELSGIELLESTSVGSQVIITSAFPEYALKGYELDVKDYLLKPFTFSRFLKAVVKAQLAIDHSSAADNDYFFVKAENRLERILIPEVLFIEGMRDYRRIHTRHKRIMTLQTFRELEKLLPANRICRIHKSYMVGLANIEAVERSQVLINGRRLTISDTYRNDFFARIKQG